MKFNYCPQCGSKLELKDIGDEGLTPYCKKCSTPYFDYFGKCIITVVVNEYNEVALLKQNYVSTTNWILVAGFIKNGETLENVTEREVYEEIGHKVEKIEYIESYYYDKKELLMIGFKSKVKKGAFTISKEVDQVEWFNFNDAENMLREGSIAKKLLIAVKEKV